MSVVKKPGCVCPGCVFSSCFMQRLCNLQFDKHGSDLEKTKLKLLEAANLVDKVMSDDDVTPVICTDKSKCVLVCV